MTKSGIYDAALDYAEACKYEGGDKLLCAEHFKAGAEWMAGQGINLPAHIFMPSGIKSVYNLSKGEYPAAVHLDGGGSLVLEKRLQNFNHNEEVIVQIRKK